MKCNMNIFRSSARTETATDVNDDNDPLHSKHAKAQEEATAPEHEEQHSRPDKTHFHLKSIPRGR